MKKSHLVAAGSLVSILVVALIYFLRTPDEPPGEYSLELWHAQFGTQTIDLNVTEGDITRTEVRFEPKLAAENELVTAP